MRIGLDTNVLLSGLLTPHGPCARVLDLVVAGEVRVPYDDRVVAEWCSVPRRPNFGFAPGRAQILIELLRSLGEPVAPVPTSIVLPDPDDVVFLEVASAGAAVAIVTGSQRD